MQFDYTKQPGLKKEKSNITSEITPLMTIITPYYNASKYFEQTYNCVINQTFPYFEWIIINDGSTEDISFLEKIVASDGRIHMICQSNAGQAAARNKGIHISKTEIIIPLDADDLIVPTYLEIVYWGLKQNTDASWCYTDSVGFQKQEYIWAKSFSADRLKYNNFLVCTAAIRKKALLQIGGYDESCNHYDEDWKLWLDLLSVGNYPVHLNVIGFWYRRTTEGMGSQVKNNKKLKKTSDSIIKSAAYKVNSSISAIEYPFTGITNRFLSPICSDWDKKLPFCKNKKNILMIFPWLEMGGADLFNLDVVKKLDKNIFHITIITTVQSDNTWIQKFEEFIDDIFTLPDFLSITDYPEFVSYIIKSRNISGIFLSNSYYGYYLLPWIRIHFPSIFICDYVHMEEWYWRNGGYSRVSAVFGNQLNKTYVCNEKSRTTLINTFHRHLGSVETLYIGVDADYYSTENIKYGTVYDRYSLNKNVPMVLFPCRIHPQKRPFLMIEIARELVKRNVEIIFMVVGDGPQLTELQAVVSDEGLSKVVYFAGRQEDMRPYYRDATVTLICSLKEGLALTAYESLAMKTPVVTADVGGQSELINSSVGRVIPLLQEEADSLDQRTFNKNEINLYVDALCDIVNNEINYPVLCENCRQRILQHFSSDKMITHLQSELEKLCLSDIVFEPYNKDQISQFECEMVELCTLYTEYELLEGYAKNVGQSLDTKNELIRIANSKWGHRLIKMAFKLKLNQLFK